MVALGGKDCEGVWDVQNVSGYLTAIVDASQISDVKAQITAIYKAHNPMKLGDVDMLMKKYKHMEDVLLRRVQEKYLPREPVDKKDDPMMPAQEEAK